MVDANGINTPLFNHCKLRKHGIDMIHDPFFFKFIVRILQYATLSRPNIAYCVNKVCQLMVNPLDKQ